MDYTDVNGKTILPGQKIVVAVHKQYGGVTLRKGTVYRLNLKTIGIEYETTRRVWMDGTYKDFPTTRRMGFKNTKRMMVVD